TQTSDAEDHDQVDQILADSGKHVCLPGDYLSSLFLMVSTSLSLALTVCADFCLISSKTRFLSASRPRARVKLASASSTSASSLVISRRRSRFSNSASLRSSFSTSRRLVSSSTSPLILAC